MKKYSLKIIIFPLIFAVSLATILCCAAFSGTTLAKTNSIVASNVMPSCHAHKGKTDNSAPKNCCNPKLQADYPSKISINITPIFTELVSLDFSSQQFSVIKTKLNLAFVDGPPGSDSDTPLYIHFRNFRI
jgi:hypothetical protein